MNEWIENKLYCGQVQVISIEQDMFAPIESKDKLCIIYNLPGYISKSKRRYQTLETAKDHANRMFGNWLNLMELKTND